jgi:hypothetical protein
MNGQAHRGNSVSSTIANANTDANSGTASPPVYRTPNYIRNSISAGCPTSLPMIFEATRRGLSTIPSTPAQGDDEKDPFDMSGAPRVPSLPALPEMVNVPDDPMGQQNLVWSV